MVQALCERGANIEARTDVSRPLQLQQHITIPYHTLIHAMYRHTCCTHTHRWVSTYLSRFLAASAGSMHSSPYIHRQDAIHTSYWFFSHLSYTRTYIHKHVKHIPYMPTYIHTYLRISSHPSARDATKYANMYVFTWACMLCVLYAYVCMYVYDM